jgi:hypothetical protein
MSRSYKKHPWNADGNYAKSGKKFAAKKVRNLDIDYLPPKGNAYKKIYEQYDIRDWVYRWTWEEALRWYRQHPDQYKEYPTEKDFYRYWFRLMKAK